MPGNQIECAEITDHSPTQAATLNGMNEFTMTPPARTDTETAQKGRVLSDMLTVLAAAFAVMGVVAQMGSTLTLIPPVSLGMALACVVWAIGCRFLLGMVVADVSVDDGTFDTVDIDGNRVVLDNGQVTQFSRARVRPEGKLLWAPKSKRAVSLELSSGLVDWLNSQTRPT